MATFSDPPPSTKFTTEPSRKAKLVGVNQSVTVSLFFGPPNTSGKCACLIDSCGNMLVVNKSTKTNFVNHMACKHLGKWKLALEVAKNSDECLETQQSSGNAATSQSMSTYKAKGPL
jgi:hypothetical protein